ncbi:type II toxin-antitoxin system VapC family toxin [uncultured Rothia sp.]|uniref:type II toxin-antitoxin system VapC family toxin n=1 Tax=uncultured Rothia sp. TaxID=316088 RepID=UPI0028D146E0|nr:type II toxin-antitoxin system VapC family toxin [uncultured Rothia sp.]
MYLLDTNVISELWKLSRGKADPVFESWFRQESEKPLYISVVTLMELERGVLAMERKDPAQGEYLREWYSAVREKFQKRTLIIDGVVANCCAGLHVPDKAPENDAWIAATALAHGLTLVTRNIKDFERLPVRLLNPSEPAT